MRIETKLSHFTPRGESGALVAGAGASHAGLVQLIREDMRSTMPGPSLVGQEFVLALKGPHSLWPSRGRTANTGPYSNNVSVRRWTVRQTRGARGRFDRVTVINDARNRRGQAYALWVNDGIRSGGDKVKPRTWARNYRSVERTWNKLSDDILSKAMDRAERKRGGRGNR